MDSSGGGVRTRRLVAMRTIAVLAAGAAWTEEWTVTEERLRIDGLPQFEKVTNWVIFPGGLETNLGLYERALVYVTADHGFDEAGFQHLWAPCIFLSTNDILVSRDGDRADVAPTIMKRFGLDVRTLSPPLAGVPLDELAPRAVTPPERPAPSCRSARAQPRAADGSNSRGCEHQQLRREEQ